MSTMDKLLESLEECGVAAAFYKGKYVLLANKLFANIFEKGIEECKGLPIMEICHEESFDIIQDFIKRRAFGDHDVPITYEAKFRTPANPKFVITITIIRTKNTDGALLVIVREKK